MADKLTQVRPTGIPWRAQVTAAMGENEWRMLLALMDTVLPPIQRESTAPDDRSIDVSYISDDAHRDFISHLRDNTIILDSASPEDLDEYLALKATDEALFQQTLGGMLLQLAPATRNLLTTVLRILT